MVNGRRSTIACSGQALNSTSCIRRLDRQRRTRIWTDYSRDYYDSPYRMARLLRRRHCHHGARAASRRDGTERDRARRPIVSPEDHGQCRWTHRLEASQDGGTQESHRWDVCGGRLRAGSAQHTERRPMSVPYQDEKGQLLCDRCGRPVVGWPLKRGGDICSPDQWVNCIREPQAVLNGLEDSSRKRDSRTRARGTKAR